MLALAVCLYWIAFDCLVFWSARVDSGTCCAASVAVFSPPCSWGRGLSSPPSFADSVQLWASCRMPFTSVWRRRRAGVVVALLLLLAGVEQNPGPSATQASSFLRLGVLNIRSVVRKGAAVRDVIVDSRLDLLVLTETWLKSTDHQAVTKDMLPPDYEVSHYFRPADGGGVAVVHRIGLQVSTVTMSSVSDLSSFECLTVKIGGKRRINVAAVYRPPSSSSHGTHVTQFCRELSLFLDEFLALPGEPFLAGDFNCPSAAGTPAVDPRLVELLGSRLLHQHVERATHEAGNILDLVVSYSDGRSLVQSIDLLDMTGLSDHKLVIANLSVCRPQPVERTFTCRNLKLVSPTAFTSIMRTKPVFLAPSDDVNGFAEQIDSAIVETLDQLAPLRVRKKRCGRPVNSWLSEAAVRAKRKRRRMETRWRRTGLESDRVLYRRACREAGFAINQSLESHYSDRLRTAAADGNHRTQWRTIRELIHSDDRQTIEDRSECRRLCDDFGLFFAGKLRKIADTVAARLNSTATLSREVIRRPCTEKMETLSTVSTDEVAKLIGKMASKNSPVDCLPVSLLRQTTNVMAPLLTRLANLSFSSGVFPSSYKLGHVTPLIKKPGLNRTDPANYRPISNLSNFSKLLERLALARLQPMVLGSRNFCPLQSAYRSGHSTETALLKLVNDIKRAAGDGKCTALLALDISAAFDSICFDTLRRRARDDFGLSGAALDWLMSFVSGRSQYVAVGEERSQPSPCTTGVPQGSVLGPLLYAMYVSPIGDVVTGHGMSYHLYADDLQVYTAIRTDQLTDLSTLESCTADVARWFLENALLLNPTKTEAVLFGTRQRLRAVDGGRGVSAAGALVSFADSLKLLGVTLDSSLSLDRHVSDVVRSCNYHIRALRHIRKRLTPEAARIAACAIVGARLDYCNSLFYGMSNKNFDKLQSVQNSLARVVGCVPWSVDVGELRRSLHWLPIRQRVIFKVAIMTYRVRTSGSPMYLSSMLQSHQPQRVLRSSDQCLLELPRVRIDFERGAFSVAAPAVWNGLPRHLQESGTVATFKTGLKTWLYQEAYGRAR